MKPMLLTSANTIPLGEEWIYETKYDGFRGILLWEKKGAKLISRNGKVLNDQFLEIVNFCDEFHHRISSYLPLTLDGEVVFLQNSFQSDFSIVQLRGRMRKKDVVMKHMQGFLFHYIAFDLLQLKGEDVTNLPLTNRKKKLREIFQSIGLPLTIHNEDANRIQAIDVFDNSESLWNEIVVHNGEGLIAKKKISVWNNEKRTNNWVKIKNWRYVDVIVTNYDKNNGFYTGAIYRGTELFDIVTFRHGLSEEEDKTLSLLFQSNGKQIVQNIWELDPSICVQIACISFDGKHLREPRFHKFQLEIEPGDCTWKQMLRQLNPVPDRVQITHPDKPIWPQLDIRKDDYLIYLQLISPYFLPFLRDRLLTVIRYPHGVSGEKFYQKNAPDYLPDFIATKKEEDIRYIVCNDLESLIWLGNQIALEFHIPFQTIKTDYPTEIVFDLDPPSVNEFSLAVEAALRLKMIFDHFQLKSFVKTSGGKGLQLYIPLPLDSFSYEETRIFTEFVCNFLVEQEPHWFTTERLKKNRKNKLYLDYVQHHEGKTIVAPYSPRGNEQGLIATPLNWEEVNDSLTPSMFSIPNVLERIKNNGDPFRDFRLVGEGQDFQSVLHQLKELINK